MVRVALLQYKPTLLFFGCLIFSTPNHVAPATTPMYSIFLNVGLHIEIDDFIYTRLALEDVIRKLGDVRIEETNPIYAEYELRVSQLTPCAGLGYSSPSQCSEYRYLVTLLSESYTHTRGAPLSKSEIEESVKTFAYSGLYESEPGAHSSSQAVRYQLCSRIIKAFDKWALHPRRMTRED